MDRNEFIKILPSYMGCEVSVLGVDKNATFIAFVPSSDGWGTLYFKNVFGAVCSSSTVIDKERGFKLLLRRVEDMTDEEYIEFIRVLQPKYVHHPSAYFYLKFRETGDLLLSTQGICNSSKQLSYLRSIGIDCDDLLSTEWAELKTNK